MTQKQNTKMVQNMRKLATAIKESAQLKDLGNLVLPYFKIGRPFGLGYDNKSRLWRLVSNLTLVLILFDISRGISFILSSPKPMQFNGALVFKCLITLYAVHTLIGYFMLRNMEKSSLGKFLRAWHRADEWHEAVWHFKYLKFCLNYGQIYVVIVSVINGVYVGLGSINGGLIVKFPWMDSYFFLKELEILNGWIVLHTSFAFFMPQIVYLAICLILSFEYSIYNDFLSKVRPHHLLSELPVLRYRHAIITKMTDQADEMMRWYAFGIYALNSPTLVITFFLLVRDWATMDAMSVFTFVCWTAMLLAQIAIISLPPAFINWQVLQELSMFVTALTRREIGISGGQFFVINKSFILTILSMILTYFSVLIQFDLGSGSCACACSGLPNTTTTTTTAHTDLYN